MIEKRTQTYRIISTVLIILQILTILVVSFATWFVSTIGDPSDFNYETKQKNITEAVLRIQISFIYMIICVPLSIFWFCRHRLSGIILIIFASIQFARTLLTQFLLHYSSLVTLPIFVFNIPIVVFILLSIFNEQKAIKEKNIKMNIREGINKPAVIDIITVILYFDEMLFMFAIITGFVSLFIVYCLCIITPVIGVLIAIGMIHLLNIRRSTVWFLTFSAIEFFIEICYLIKVAQMQYIGNDYLIFGLLSLISVTVIVLSISKLANRNNKKSAGPKEPAETS